MLSLTTQTDEQREQRQHNACEPSCARDMLQLVMQAARPLVDRIIKEHIIPQAELGHVWASVDLFDLEGVNRTNDEQVKDLHNRAPGIVLTLNELGYQCGKPEMTTQVGIRVYILPVAWSPIVNFGGDA